MTKINKPKRVRDMQRQLVAIDTKKYQKFKDLLLVRKEHYLIPTLKRIIDNALDIEIKRLEEAIEKDNPYVVE